MPLRSRIDPWVMHTDPRWEKVPETDRRMILTLIEAGRTIEGIKHYRACTGAGLAAAKGAVDALIVAIEFRVPENGPPCPQCGRKLRTAKAQQCFHCGADWHGQI
jgi:hypothetical protein